MFLKRYDVFNTMKKFWIQIIFLSLIIIGSFYALYNQQILAPFVQTTSMNNIKQLKINNSVIGIEVADTAEKRSQGLSGRQSLDPDSGMLFIFESPKKYQFWMRGMKLPLDFIFIKDGKVMDLLRNVKPPMEGQKDSTLPIYQPIVPINMMLEVNANYIDSHAISVGDQVYLVEPEPPQ